MKTGLRLGCTGRLRKHVFLQVPMHLVVFRKPLHQNAHHGIPLPASSWPAQTLHSSPLARSPSLAILAFLLSLPRAPCQSLKTAYVGSNSSQRQRDSSRIVPYQGLEGLRNHPNKTKALQHTSNGFNRFSDDPYDSFKCFIRPRPEPYDPYLPGAI